jgi:hypothetical protein
MLALGRNPGEGASRTEMKGSEPVEHFIFGLQPKDVEGVTPMCGEDTDVIELSIDTPAIALTTVKRNLQRSEPPFNAV